MSKIIHKCDRCGGQAYEWHHKFHRHKNRLETFGVYLIDHPLNGAWLCYSCHNQHKAEYHFNQREFCEVMELFKYCRNDGLTFCKKSDWSETKNDCSKCKDFIFDKKNYYDDMYRDNRITEKTLIPGSYGYKE